MLYILLIIIAIGVLLISEPGRKLLSILAVLAFIAGGLYLMFWIVIFAIAFLSEKETRDNVLSAIGGVMFLIYVIYGIYLFYQKYQRGEFRKEIIKSKVKQRWIKEWNESFVSKIAIVFLLITFPILIFMILYSFSIDSFWG